MMSRMKRIVRCIRNLYLALSLLLFAAVLVLWHRSYHADHSMWTRWQLRHDSTRLRSDCFVCDRGRVSWSCREELTWSSPNDRIIWRSYSRIRNCRRMELPIRDDKQNVAEPRSTTPQNKSPGLRVCTLWSDLRPATRLRQIRV